MFKNYTSKPNLKLQKKIENLPKTFGIYKMLDQKGKILYIGKAKNLKNRVQSYFTSNHTRAFTKHLVAKIKDIEIIITKNEKEALLLENDQIKQFKPFYNIQLKDQKTYPYLCLTTKEVFPRLFKTREIKKNLGLYFGPFTDLSALYKTYDLIHSLYPLKKCRQKRFPKYFKPCTYFHVGLCLDYCTGNIKQETIDEMVKEITAILKGNHEKLVIQLKETMKTDIKELNYEKAAIVKKRIDTLESLKLKRLEITHAQNNMDIFNYSINEDLLIIALIKIRNGKLYDKKNYEFESSILLKTIDEDDKQKIILGVFSHFLLDYYRKNHTEFIGEIITPFEPFFLETTLEILKDIFKKNFKSNHIEINQALKGNKKRLLDLAHLNAKVSFHEAIKRNEKKRVGKYLKEFLKLPREPKTIEAFDIANTASQAIMAGMVRFENGEKDVSNYRLFNIQSSKTQNDFISIEEAVLRRYQRLLKEKKPLPDLILIDGGKGQLSAAKKSLDQLGIKGQPIISLAKKEEMIYVPKKQEGLQLNIDNPALNFLIQVRNEVHRFTNKSHISKRDKENLQSALLKIKGLGKGKIKILLKNFNSIKNIANCEKKKLINLPFFSENDYLRIRDFLKKNEKN